MATIGAASRRSARNGGGIAHFEEKPPCLPGIPKQAGWEESMARRKAKRKVKRSKKLRGRKLKRSTTPRSFLMRGAGFSWGR